MNHHYQLVLSIRVIIKCIGDFKVTLNPMLTILPLNCINNNNNNNNKNKNNNNIDPAHVVVTYHYAYHYLIP